MPTARMSSCRSLRSVLSRDITDETASGAKTSVLGLQLHAGQPMTVPFKDLILTTGK